MRIINRALNVGSIAMLVVGMLGCAVTEPPSTGNEALDVESFEITDTAETTTVVGFDAEGTEVGRLELVHGRFALTGAFRDDYDTAEVDGRKLEVTLDGKTVMRWQTAGYAPVLSIPAHPSNMWKLSAFLADPHVKPVLDAWQIGFQPSADQDVSFSPSVETAYKLCGPEDLTSGSYTGSYLTECSGQTSCGSVQGKTINTCGGGSAPGQAWKVKQSWGGTNQWKLAQCCTNSSSPFFGIKTCPFSGTTSECGTGNGACKACPEYPVALLPGGCGCNVWGFAPSTVSWQFDGIAL